jgi:hypothetical protein
MSKLIHKILSSIILLLFLITMNSAFAQDLATTCKQELNFCKIVYQRTVNSMNDHVSSQIVLEHRTINQIYDDFMLSGSYGTFEQVNQAAYFMKSNHIDPSSISEFTPLTLEVLEYNKSGLNKYLGNVYEFASIPNFEPDNLAKCFPENLDYYKKVYNSMIYSFNGHSIEYNLHGQNMTVDYVNNEIFSPVKNDVYDKVNEASYCLHVNNVNPSSLAQFLPDTVRVLNYDTAKLQQYLPNFTSYSSVPEFPFAIPVFIISVASLIIFYRMKFR